MLCMIDVYAAALSSGTASGNPRSISPFMFPMIGVDDTPDGPGLNTSLLIPRGIVLPLGAVDVSPE